MLVGGGQPEPYGAIGVAAGLILSPIAFGQTLHKTGSVSQAIGAAGESITAPISETIKLLFDPAGVDL